MRTSPMKVIPAKSLPKFDTTHAVRGDGVIAALLLLRPEGALDDARAEPVVVHQDRATRRALWREERRTNRAAVTNARAVDQSAGVALPPRPERLPWTPQPSATFWDAKGDPLVGGPVLLPVRHGALLRGSGPTPPFADRAERARIARRSLTAGTP